ncbi:GNAT family N-acetyltransferase [Marinospirillum sp.]|uniref:GNAT family N-acetyltransferase n=1 Tax=Marinospirillum sp. TaxID=2183934 RepID=UPI0028704BB1|nr:GNAT family N-acetyltransferase [Marinospirillum sp.]MDR9468903.1 GNAT family N-acetyltransferase [Marinospirillum sp.]
MPTIYQPETPRLLLRQWQPEDREPFAAMNADPKVMKYFPRTFGREESDRIAQLCEELIRQLGWGFWALELKETGEFIGFTGLHAPTDPLPFVPCIEIGWRLAKSHWGKGYATEAARAALKVGFEQLHLEEILSFAAVGNQASVAVMQRLGMEFVEHFEHPALPEGHPLRPHLLYKKVNPDRVN